MNLKIFCVLNKVLSNLTVTESHHIETVTLANIGDEFQPEPRNWRSFSFSVEIGEVDISDDGVNFNAHYTSTSDAGMLGQGTQNPSNANDLVLKATVADTVVQVIGDYIA